MTKSTQTIIAFVEVLKTQATLLLDTTQDLLQLEQQIMTLEDEQNDKMAKAIKSFCKNYPPIREAVRSFSDAERGAGGTPPPEMTPENEKKLREQLINAIRVNIPATSSESKPKPNSNQASR